MSFLTDPITITLLGLLTSVMFVSTIYEYLSGKHELVSSCDTKLYESQTNPGMDFFKMSNIDQSTTTSSNWPRA